MITWGESATKQPIPFYNGKALASEADPVQEATDWVQKQGKTIVSGGTIFVLGLGGGYHLEALTKMYPHTSVVVIETNQDLLDAVEYDNENVKILSVLEFETWVSENRDCLIGPYCVLLHPCTDKRETAVYWSIEQLLTGRSMEALNLHLSLRPELQAVFSKFNYSEPALMSIKHVEQHLKSLGSPYDREVRVWMALREIVK